MNTRVSESLMKEGAAPTFTEAIKRGVRWKPEPPGAERFDNALTVGLRGWGDCDDLAPMRAAELRVSGKDPEARAVAYKSGPGRWHAIVQRGDGRLEDPSRTAGMRVREGSFAAGIAPAVVGCMGNVVVGGAVRPFVAVRRDSEGYLARVDVPVEGESFSISCLQRGRSPSRALSGCMAGASQVCGAAGMTDVGQLDRMWALHGLMKGASASEVCAICGVDATRDALETLQEIAPALVAELRKHWDDARTIREDFDRRRKGAASKGGAVPFSDSSTRTDGAAHDDWSGRFGHGRTESPYLDRYGDRGRNFVGSATDSPYYEMARQRQQWGVPRAYQSEQGAPTMRQTTMAMVGAATESPYTARWRNAHTWAIARAGVSPEAVEGGVGSATMSPYMARWLGERPEGWGVRRAGVSEQSVGAFSLLKPTISFSLAGAGTHRRHHRARARHIVHKVHFGDALDRALRAPPVPATVGWDLFKDVIQPAGNFLNNIVSKPVQQATGINANFHIDVQKTISDIGKGAKDVLQAAQGVISLIPGIGTGISSAISAGLALLSGGSPLEIAVKAAYGAIPIPPGLRSMTDVVVDAALALTHTANLADNAIGIARKAIVDQLPAVAKDIGGTVFDTLAHLVLGNVHNAPTHAVVTPAPRAGFPPKVSVVRTPAHYATLAQVAARQAMAKAAPKKVVALHFTPPKPPARPAPAKPPPKPAIVPVHAMAPPPRPAPTPARPLTLDVVVRSFQPMVIQHRMVVPTGVRV
jgi:hypothetical protein